MAKRKVNNLLALAILSVLVERPMHRYEIAAKLRERGKDQDMDIKWGSLYTVVQNMTKAGFLEVVGSERDGARPERVIYRITDAGRAEMSDWTRELVASPRTEHRAFTAGLSVIGALPPEEVIDLLATRIAALDAVIARVRAELDGLASRLPRLFVIETEYSVAMLEAEAAWARAWRAELVSGEFPDLPLWRRMHEPGASSAELIAMVERGFAEPEPQE
ncbi:PadR family transcriptional regulator [Nocardia puris]|uniref:PadR family transcriptional regulator n=1 Tax=Nocardia puris TaxID=208602 RepID=UPI0018961B86|nr:PadR family transcriptional regulator [Nocardia puris]MBF6215547.1 PadR family transcriptional regulator [Nocardia puris]MBF6370044.1 PadR family transcriptional regulator [Nocardia puris]MBF6463490.1 PadR family transcriptional regulator [Nocardia puris]